MLGYCFTFNEFEWQHSVPIFTLFLPKSLLVYFYFNECIVEMIQ